MVILIPGWERKPRDKMMVIFHTEFIEVLFKLVKNREQVKQRRQGIIRTAYEKSKQL